MWVETMGVVSGCGCKDVYIYMRCVGVLCPTLKLA